MLNQEQNYFEQRSRSQLHPIVHNQPVVMGFHPYSNHHPLFAPHFVPSHGANYHPHHGNSKQWNSKFQDYSRGESSAHAQNQHPAPHHLYKHQPQQKMGWVYPPSHVSPTSYRPSQMQDQRVFPSRQIDDIEPSIPERFFGRPTALNQQIEIDNVVAALLELQRAAVILGKGPSQEKGKNPLQNRPMDTECNPNISTKRSNKRKRRISSENESDDLVPNTRQFKQQALRVIESA